MRSPEEELAIAEQRLEYERQRTERAFRGLYYLIFGQWILIVISTLANHFWK
jgi:hypothetical protein